MSNAPQDDRDLELEALRLLAALTDAETSLADRRRVFEIVLRLLREEAGK